MARERFRRSSREAKAWLYCWYREPDGFKATALARSWVCQISLEADIGPPNREEFSEPACTRCVARLGARKGLVSVPQTSCLQ